MKPLNANDPTCNPISSNCVIWQGPDIPCIKLCKGDSVSVVVYKLATELCTLLEQTDVSVYDLDCLITGCGPSNFQQLVQLLIDKICACCSVTPTPPNPNRSDLDTEVVVAPCFQYTNSTGDLVTTMTILDYVIAIGNKVCNLVSEINTINDILIQYNIRITALENAPPPVLVLPKVTPNCLLSPPSTPVDMNIALQELIVQYCALVIATGSGSEILTALTYECVNLSNLPQLSNPVSNMGSLPGWNTTVSNLADSITNMWLTICDMRAAISNIQSTCCPSGCDLIDVTMTGYISGSTVHLVFNGTIPPGFTQCAPGTTTFTIVDQSGNTIIRTGDVISVLNNASGLTYDLTGTTINLADNLNISATLCLNSSSPAATCQSILQTTIVNTELCPTMTYTPTTNSISYTGLINVGTADYTVELWNSAGTILLQSNTTTITAPGTLSGNFSGLTPSTTYKLRVVVNKGELNEVVCQFSIVQTIAVACLPAINVTSNLIIP